MQVAQQHPSEYAETYATATPATMQQAGGSIDPSRGYADSFVTAAHAPPTVATGPADSFITAGVSITDCFVVF